MFLRTYFAFGYAIEVRANDGCVADVLDNHLADSLPNGRAPFKTFSLDVLVTSDRPTPDHHHVHVDESLAVLEVSSAFGVALLGRGRAIISIGAQDCRDPHLFGKTVVESLIFDLVLSELNVWSIHASGLLAPDGSGVAICGERGQGKSTLAHALALEGWQLVSEDALVHVPGLNPSAFVGQAQTISAAAQAQELLGLELTDWSYEPVPGAHRGRLNTGAFDVQEFMAHLDLIVLPQIGAERSRVQPLGAADEVKVEFKVFGHKRAEEMSDINLEIDAALAEVDFVTVHVDSTPRGCAAILSAYLEGI